MASSATTTAIVLLLLFTILAVTTTARPCKTIFLTTFTNPSSSLHDHLTTSSIVGFLFFAVGCAVVLYSIWYFFFHACIHSHDDDDVSVLNNNNNGHVAVASNTNMKDNKNLKHNNKNLNYNNQQPDSDEVCGDHNEAAAFVWTPRLCLERMEGLSGSGGDSATGHLFDNDRLNHQQPNFNEFDSSELGIGDNGEPARIIKRRRFVWTPELHKRFVNAVAQLGIKNAVPQTIMQLMSVDGLTRENVASHLQNYRLYLKRMQSLSVSSGDPSADHLSAVNG